MHLSWRRWTVFGLLGLGIMLGPGRPGCNEVTRFEVQTTEKTTIAGSDLPVELLTLAFPDLATFDITESNELQNQGVSREDIDSVTIDAFVLRVTAPAGQDLTFFDSIEFFVEAEGQEKKRIAWQDTFPAGVAEVALNVEQVELRDYVAAESMAVTTDVSARQPSEDTTLEADITFIVDASVQGACNAIKEGIE